MDSNLRGKNYRFPQCIHDLRLRDDDHTNYFPIKYLALTATTNCTVEVDQPSGLAYMLYKLIGQPDPPTIENYLSVCIIEIVVYT